MLKDKKSNVKVFISFFILFLLICMSMAGFFHKKEHFVCSLWYEGDVTPHGYKVKKSGGRKFYYKKKSDDAYLDIEGSRVEYAGTTSDSFMLRFESVAPKDEDVRFVLLNSDGQEVFTKNVTWKKDSVYFKVDFDDSDEKVVEALSGEKFHVKVYIDDNFSFPMYYMSVPGTSSKYMMAAMTVSPVIAAIIACIFTFIKPFRRFADFLKKKQKSCMDYIAEHRKEVCKIAAGVALCAAASVLSAYLISHFTKYGFGKPLIFMVFMVLFFIYISVFLRKIFAKNIELYGTLLIFMLGTVYSFGAPAVSGLNFDDQDHFSNVFFPSTFLERRISFADWDNFAEAGSALVTGDSYDYAFRRGLEQFRNDMDKEHYYIGAYQGLKSFSRDTLSYIPHIIGYFVGKLLHLPWSARFMLGRWGMVIFLSIISYISMKKLRSGKMIIFMVAAMPGVIFLASSYSYDIWLLGWMMLGLSMFFGEKQDTERKLTLKKALAISIAFVLSNVSKPVYFPLFVIAFFMPMYKFENKKNYWLYKLLNIVTMFVPVAMVMITTLFPGLGVGDPRGGSDVNASAQMSGFLSNPSHGLSVIGKFLSTFLNPFYDRTSWFNRLGYMGSIKIGIYGAIILTVCSFLAVNRKEPAKYPWWYRLGVLAVYGVIGFMVAFTMYISYTPVGADTVNGCQARYILPAIFPVLFACSRWSADAVLSRSPKLDSISRREIMGCPATYIRDVIIAALIIIPNVLGVYSFIVR